MNPVISINTLAYEGYDLKTALQEIAKIGASHVELGYTQGWTEGLTEEHFSEASAVDIGLHRQRGKGLRSDACSGSCEEILPGVVHGGSGQRLAGHGI